MQATRTTLLIALAVASLGVAACDDGGSKTASTAPAPAAAPPPPPPPPPPAPAASGMPGLTAPFATEADWVADCKGTGLDVTICDCAVKATTKTLGANALYTWVHEAYVKRNSVAHARSKKWFTETGVDETKQKSFAAEISKCYVTQ
jgi:hypothetical protein